MKSKQMQRAEHENAATQVENAASAAAVRPREDNNSENDTGMYLRID